MIDIYDKEYEDGFIFEDPKYAAHYEHFKVLNKRIDFLEKRNKQLDQENQALSQKLASYKSMVEVLFEIMKDKK
ncbi:hypothetical protein FC52_GL000877 [Lactobacillus pasteurii DSM 23907 = CRBIP 24.76]|uniref:Uncharacterized protein n=1 Tax=Lactobacillus pasteurii DSM 23907 = CRBIP 24.76 TaxID=1423790 RepID=I7JY78_9LACO|nr:hypothetical protein [Lactobacillus pasteurii]KRK07215.1 hypothetical protein FC52_GL000877 [Lactobacillus pasteurii DSM 23907 = CRBIP 24.76]TDG76601.1 hypothetical protein C5L33_001360 [Lactobacillus pasteurii]CCI85305.1 Protein of unknown function [Lactobacillus pasteurii DSM 23907 = CRBIP 24.76]